MYVIIYTEGTIWDWWYNITIIVYNNISFIYNKKTVWRWRWSTELIVVVDRREERRSCCCCCLKTCFFCFCFCFLLFCLFVCVFVGIFVILFFAILLLKFFVSSPLFCTLLVLNFFCFRSIFLFFVGAQWCWIGFEIYVKIWLASSQVLMFRNIGHRTCAGVVWCSLFNLKLNLIPVALSHTEQLGF